jgi:hypothetical protein
MNKLMIELVALIDKLERSNFIVRSYYDF